MPTRRWVRSSLGVQGKRFITYPKGGSFPSLFPGAALLGRDVSPFGDLAIVRWGGAIARWFRGEDAVFVGFLGPLPRLSGDRQLMYLANDITRSEHADRIIRYRTIGLLCASLNFPRRRRHSLAISVRHSASRMKPFCIPELVAPARINRNRTLSA
jgi:hypothetical protein